LLGTTVDRCSTLVAAAVLALSLIVPLGCGGATSTSDATRSTSSVKDGGAQEVESALQEWFASAEYENAHGPAKPVRVQCQPANADFDGHAIYQCPTEFDDDTATTWCAYVSDGELYSNGRQDEHMIDCIAHSQPAE
jgi:hypothetical protein